MSRTSLVARFATENIKTSYQPTDNMPFLNITARHRIDEMNCGRKWHEVVVNCPEIMEIIDRKIAEIIQTFSGLFHITSEDNPVLCFIHSVASFDIGIHKPVVRLKHAPENFSYYSRMSFDVGNTNVYRAEIYDGNLYRAPVHVEPFLSSDLYISKACYLIVRRRPRGVKLEPAIIQLAEFFDTLVRSAERKSRRSVDRKMLTDLVSARRMRQKRIRTMMLSSIPRGIYRVTPVEIWMRIVSEIQ